MPSRLKIAGKNAQHSFEMHRHKCKVLRQKCKTRRGKVVLKTDLFLYFKVGHYILGPSQEHGGIGKLDYVK